MTNHHSQEAERLIGADNVWSIGYETADAQHIVGHLEANTQATLALAYEQRTANLIAYQANVEASYVKAEVKGPRSDGAEKLNDQIKERLGLA